MPLVVKDRVKETTTTTGTGTLTLAGASPGFQSFSVIGNANTTYYTITDGTNWEVGIGTYTASGTTLSRDTILESSNSGNAVNWGAGSKDVFVTYPAERSAFLDTLTESTGYFDLPVGTTAQRPGSPVDGVFRVNSSTQLPEIYISSVWKPFLLGGVPGAPTIGTATATGTTTATVSYTAPSNNGGSTITSYTATSNPGGVTGTISQAGSGTINMTGLTQGVAYTFTVTATSVYGTSAASAASNSITTWTVPGAPTIGTATATGLTTATVSFTPPANTGGTAITGYTVTSSPGGITATGASSPISVTGLTSGTAYTFTVTATNSVGTGSPSAASNSIRTYFNVEYLVVAGGGAGAAGSRGGAGGAGGLLQSASTTIAPGTAYTVTIGGGGTIVAYSNVNTADLRGTNGSNSVFSGATAIGGGRGGGADNTMNGTAGGSGGGAWYLGSGGAGTSGQGNAGGSAGTSGVFGGGAGGGAGGVGGNGTSAAPGNGGAGIASSITGVSTGYAGGGAGANYNSATSGSRTAGGGLGNNTNPSGQAGTSGTANTGGGGGSGGTGGSGVVIIAYSNTFPNLASIGGGLSWTLDTTTRAGFKVYRFTGGTGSINW